MIAQWLRSIDRFLPQRLTTRIMVSMITIVVSAGIVTTIAINQVLARGLREELDNSGHAMTVSLGESLANPMLEGNLVSIQEMLDHTIASNPDVVYVFAYGPHTPIVHTFRDGFPRDLLRLLNTTPALPSNPTLLQTEDGLVREFVYQPLLGVSAAIHVGISENRIRAEQRNVALFVLALTGAGVVAASGITFGLGRLLTLPLVELTQRVHRLGKGQLDERIGFAAGGEIGELSQAFNAMADEIQTAIHRLSVSEAGYRVLLTAAADVGEGIALIAEGGSDEGTLLFVNDTFAHLVGVENQALLGLNVSSVLYPDSIELAYRTWESIRSGAMLSGTTELVITTRKGQHRVVETASTRIEYQGRPVLAWFTRDVTDRKAREQELRLRYRELSALNAVASALNEPASPNFLQRALHETLQALDLRLGWIILIGPNGKAEMAAHEGFDPLPTSIDFPNCACSEALGTGNPTFVDADQHCALRGVGHVAGGLLRHVTIPLRTSDKTFGVLSVGFPPERSFDDNNLRLLAAIGKPISIALENADLWNVLREKEQLRSELLARSLHAQEGERQRIARELHDATGQSLNAMVFGLKAAETALPGDPARAHLVINRLKAAASDTVHELQTIIYNLRPSVLDDLGLIPALRWYAEQHLAGEGIQVDWDIQGDERRLPPEIETALFRIGQEAMSNIRKYAGPQVVRISLRFEEDQLVLQIDDDGTGFDVEAVLARHLEDGRGLGLLGMRERAELMGGSFEIRSTAGQGTKVRVVLPVFTEKQGKQYEREDTHPAGG